MPQDVSAFEHNVVTEGIDPGVEDINQLAATKPRFLGRLGDERELQEPLHGGGLARRIEVEVNCLVGLAGGVDAAHTADRSCAVVQGHRAIDGMGACSSSRPCFVPLGHE